MFLEIKDWLAQMSARISKNATNKISRILMQIRGSAGSEKCNYEE